jgi:hypothetical protein
VVTSKIGTGEDCRNIFPYVGEGSKCIRFLSISDGMESAIFKVDAVETCFDCVFREATYTLPDLRKREGG